MMKLIVKGNSLFFENNGTHERRYENLYYNNLILLLLKCYTYLLNDILKF